MPAQMLDRAGPSDAERAAEMIRTGQATWDDIFGAEPDEALERLEHDWTFWGRPAQQIPAGEWFVWLIMSGRGFGKTRTGAETIHAWTEDYPLVILAGETAYDVRETMVEGESGIMATARPDHRPQYEPSKRRLTWPNGARGLCLGLGEEPDLARGPQAYKAWCDEVAKWQYAEEAWENLTLGLRLGDKPQALVTTTPKPRKIIRDLLKDASTVLTKASSYENIGNLSPVYIRQVIKPKEGTRLGRQEIYADLLEDVPGALWKREMLRYGPAPRDGLGRWALDRIVVAIDPATTSSETSNETGIICAGRDGNNHGYVLGDYSGRMSPLDWGKAAIRAYLENHADRIVYEANQGGDMIPAVLRMAAIELGVPTPPLTAVHASRGKRTRAEPISAIYEQGRIWHLRAFEILEDQMVTWTPEEESPDRMDALVWAFTELLVDTPEPVDPEVVALIRSGSLHRR